jgi:hypothetical protein
MSANIRERHRGGRLSISDVYKLEKAGFQLDAPLRDHSIENKRKLLDMARSGDERPILGKHPLASAFRSYLREVHDAYDAEFVKEIAKLAPDWFADHKQEEKRELLMMAKRGDKRPTKSSSGKMGQRFFVYTYKRSRVYDPVFESQVKEIRPDWFVTLWDLAKQKKDRLLEMARKGEMRPIQKKHELGSSLTSYTNRDGGCYDPDFDKQIRSLRPDWFVGQSEKADCVKMELISMANGGCSRPSPKKSSLGRALCCFTNCKNKCYDIGFDKKIRMSRPDWFVTKKEKQNQKKQQLLAMALNGDAKPVCDKHPLGQVFGCYTNPNGCHYDPEFDKEIRRLRPDWFDRSRNGKKVR